MNHLHRLAWFHYLKTWLHEEMHYIEVSHAHDSLLADLKEVHPQLRANSLIHPQTQVDSFLLYHPLPPCDMLRIGAQIDPYPVFEHALNTLNLDQPYVAIDEINHTKISKLVSWLNLKLRYQYVLISFPNRVRHDMATFRASDWGHQRACLFHRRPPV